MTPRLFIAVACHNRKAVAEQCLPTLRDSLHKDDSILLYNDGSTEYDSDWLAQFGSGCVVDGGIAVGIQAQRREHLRHFLFAQDATHLLLADHDIIWDPSYREHALNLQFMYGEPPLCLYNTNAHASLANNLRRDTPGELVIWRHFAPGCAYLLTRAHVQRLKPHIESLKHFDWEIPALLGYGFATSRTSYCDHIGWGGERHPKGAGLDEGDRALNPTPWLQKKRAEVVAALKAQMPPAISTP